MRGKYEPNEGSGIAVETRESLFAGGDLPQPVSLVNHSYIGIYMPIHCRGMRACYCMYVRPPSRAQVHVIQHISMYCTCTDIYIYVCVCMYVHGSI